MRLSRPGGIGDTLDGSMLSTSGRFTLTRWLGSNMSVFTVTRSPFMFTTTPVRVSPFFIFTMTGTNCSLISRLGLMI